MGRWRRSPANCEARCSQGGFRLDDPQLIEDVDAHRDVPEALVLPTCACGARSISLLIRCSWMRARPIFRNGLALKLPYT